MSKVFDQLRQLHPPTAPATVTPDHWAVIEKEMATALPDDYKTLLGLYAGGPPFAERYDFYNFLETEDRIAAQKDLAHLHFIRGVVYGELLHTAQLLSRPESSVQPPIPFPVHPEPRGLYPWGWAQDGWTFYWLCEAAPNDWEVIAGFKWVEEFRRFPGKTATELLLEIADLPPSANLESVLKMGIPA